MQLNGFTVGEVSFDSQQQGIGKFNIEHALLREGQNSVRLIAQNGQSDVSLVDSIRLFYQHKVTADDNSLKLTVNAGERVTMNGFTAKAIRVFDVTNENETQELSGEITQDKSGYAITVAANGSGARKLPALTEGQARKPASIKQNQPSNWRSNANAASFVILTTGNLFSTLQPLQMIRESEGYKVALIDVEDVYDEFNLGQKSPQAILDLLWFAHSNWKLAPRFILLAGDASFDAKNYLGRGDWDLVPTKLLGTTFLETASDDWFADFTGDGISDMAVGRLPIRTTEEAMNMLQKILRYQQSEVPPSALLVSDVNDGFHFEQSSSQLRSVLLAAMKIEELQRGRLDATTAKARLIEAISRGQRFVNYAGHGSVNLWRGNLLTSQEARSLTNESLPVFVMMSCLNNYFQDPTLDSLGESLLKAEGGGAVAVWASTGLTNPQEQALMNQEFYRSLLSALTNSSGGSFKESANRITLGEAVQRAKSSVRDTDIRRTWILLGDPTMRLQ